MWIHLLTDPTHHVPMQWAWMDPLLVAISVIVAVCSASMALHMAGLARKARRATTRNLAQASGACCLGGGIWSMHFIGMLAFTPCANGSFSTLLSTLSALPSLLAAAWVMRALQRPAPWPRLLLSGSLFGAGVAAMHFGGMAASDAASSIRYAPLGLLLAVVVGVGLATAGLALHQRLLQAGVRLRTTTMLSGALLGLSVSGMHYAAMGAIYWPVGDTVAPDPLAPNYWPLVLVTAAVCLALGLLALGVNLIVRWSELFAQIRRSEARLRAVVDTAVDGIIMIEGDGRICAFNPAAERLLGWSAAEVLGRNVSMLMPPTDQQAHDGYLQRHLRTGATSIIGSGREVHALHKEGEQVAVRLAVGRVLTEGPPLFVGFLTDIRQRRAMEASLRHSEEQHRTLISNIPGVTFRRAGRGIWQPLFLSKPVETLTGWPAEALLSQPQRMEALVLSQDIPGLTEAVYSAIDAGVAYSHEYRLRHRDGSVRWVRESGRGVYDEDGQLRWIDGVLIDHTETKARNAEFEGTVTAINRAVAVVEYSLDGHVLHANQNFLEMFGYSLDEVQGEHYHLFCLDTPQCHAETALMWQQLQRGDFASLECQARVKHGELLWVQTTFSPILDAGGKTLRITQLLTDITASRTLSDALLQAKEKAEAAAAARSTFLANMSHEIRTPMNAIIGFSETLLDTPLGATQQRYVETVYRSARSMLRLLNDILDTAKLDKGAVQLEEEDFVVADVCHLVVGTLRIQAEKKGLHLLLDIQPQVPAYLRGDALRIQQVLTNLMGNAVKFTERGHVLLEVGYHQGMLQLRVQDTGIGIAQEKLSHIFDPFAQADASTTRRYGGTGLGTTISRQLTQLMGGQISVRSQLGAGTEFLVQLPLPAGQAPERRLPAAHGATLPALRILAVDDVPQNLELLQVVMQRYGHNVALAHDGHEAVRLRQTQDFDLILMDLQMPHMDGLEAARSIRHWEAAHGQRHMPIIALSASVLAQDRQNSDAAGMDGFATKPLELPKLMAEMARVLSEHPPATPAGAPLQAAAPATASAYALDGSVADWDAGLALWGGVEPLRAAWTRFLGEQHGRTQELRQRVQQGDWEGIRTTVHRMRGAAGNLGLQPLQTLLAQMEHDAQHQDRAALEPQLPQLAKALAQVEALLRASAPAATPAAPPRTAATLSPAQQSQALAALHALGEALQQGEIASPALQAVQQLLPAPELVALLEALDLFEFERALECVRTLSTRLETCVDDEPHAHLAPQP
ncbi:PAS domain S-box protein [Comamonas sp. CAH-2]|uniref:PAS domain S-box protein n=1 Tax=Comamonas sp. CAH-2 TaxID=2605745 RepID=UPI0012AE74D7|nr:PAS domain S-box protein [Comamonas sp. CAH-2]MRT22054.1 PAS domain S-box protein [Comamonas sp. CAH-2]